MWECVDECYMPLHDFLCYLKHNLPAWGIIFHGCGNIGFGRHEEKSLAELRWKERRLKKVNLFICDRNLITDPDCLSEKSKRNR